MGTKNTAGYSRNYEKVKEFYDGGYWNKTRLKNAVAKGWITENEYAGITGNKYND